MQPAASVRGATNYTCRRGGSRYNYEGNDMLVKCPPPEPPFLPVSFNGIITIAAGKRAAAMKINPDMGDTVIVYLRTQR